MSGYQDDDNNASNSQPPYTGYSYDPPPLREIPPVNSIRFY